ncbi:hypothetical protein [Rickettsiella endosymbiont of Xylota segnis]|uniref:hypothetical protein n=1 Tax=Rickettsiella endosymbiont of Xylota segnis TaxID=3066238 RepID=UPI0030CFF1B5
MDENIIIFFGLVWFVINRLYINSCIQEDRELQKGLAKISDSLNVNENILIPGMSRNTRSMFGLGIASIGILIGLFLMYRTLANQATVANEVTPTRPSENAVNQINNPPSSSFFQANNTSKDTLIAEEKKSEEQKINYPK